MEVKNERIKKNPRRKYNCSWEFTSSLKIAIQAGCVYVYHYMYSVASPYAGLFIGKEQPSNRNMR